MTAADLARAYAEGSADPLKVAERCLASCEADTLGALISIDRVGALQAATAARDRFIAGHSLGPWDGVPFAAKDNIAAAGLRWTAGMEAYRERVAESDAETLAWLKAQGALLIAKCNMHEAALGTSNDNPWFGRCHNPHRRDYTPGGSSGGSAAAVAAGLVPLALGTDTLGSVRIPAACCGIYGYKPSHGRVSQHGVTPLCEQLDTIGLLAANIEDLLRYGASLAGVEATAKSAPVVVGVLDAGALAVCDNDVQRAYLDAIATLTAAGLRAVEVAWPGKAQMSMLRRAGLRLVEAEAYHAHREALTARPETFSAELVKFLRYGRDLSPEALAEARADIDRLSTELQQQFGAVDCVLTPVAPQPAHAFLQPAPSYYADYTTPASLSGRPAAALPLVMSGGALPVGLQVIGHHGEDAELLAQAVVVDGLLVG